MTRAFTLLEIAIVLVVVAMMTVFGLQYFGTDNGEACSAQTQEQLGRIQAALQSFTTTHGRLPKPARMNYGSSNPQFGAEAMGGVTDPTNAAYASDVPAGVINSSGVLIGTLPHTALGLTSEFASDCWGDKFTYVVTNALTSSNSTVGYGSAATGAITVNGNTLGAPSLLSNRIAYVVVSHGVDKYGATPISASDRTPVHCNGSSVPKIDRENCNSDATFFNSTRNTGDTVEHFDDLVVYGTKMPANCPAAAVNWLTHCTGSTALILHGANEVVSNAAPGYSGSVTVACNDGVRAQSGETCVAGPPPCDSDSSDGLAPAQTYCAGVVFGECTSYLQTDSPETFYGSCSCDGSQCQSGSATQTLVMGDRSTCPGGGIPHPITMGCQDDYACTCN